MDISKILNSTNTVNTRNTKNILDKNAFLQILTVQLSNQDPLNAKDNTEYIAQMAQFSALEQMQNLNVTIEKLLLSQKFTQASNLVGKTVQAIIGEQIETVIVDGAKAIGKDVFVTSKGNQINIDNIVGIETNKEE